MSISFESDFEPSEVFYLDNISILDLINLNILKMNHIIHIKEALEEDKSSNSSEILSKIQSIIQNDCSQHQSTLSRIKEIGIIQTLIKINKLKENSFLIIDELEASLHPEWEIKFAEILVLIVKELNIHISEFS